MRHRSSFIQATLGVDCHETRHIQTVGLVDSRRCDFVENHRKRWACLTPPPVNKRGCRMEGKTMLIMYRGYTLVPVREEAKSQVKVFSRSNFIMGTRNCADDESAIIEAKKLVDAILHSRQCGQPVAWPQNSPVAPSTLPSRHL